MGDGVYFLFLPGRLGRMVKGFLGDRVGRIVYAIPVDIALVLCDVISDILVMSANCMILT